MKNDTKRQFCAELNVSDQIKILPKISIKHLHRKKRKILSINLKDLNASTRGIPIFVRIKYLAPSQAHAMPIFSSCYEERPVEATLACFSRIDVFFVIGQCEVQNRRATLLVTQVNVLPLSGRWQFQYMRETMEPMVVSHL